MKKDKLGIFESERLYFREFTVDDSELIRELNSDPAVTRYVNDSTISWQPIEVLQRIIIPQYRLYHYGRWAVHLRHNNNFIGWCGLKFRPEHLYVDLGYRYLQKYWGNGYATEAATACLQYGLHNLQLPKIVAMAHLENQASWKVLEKAGMSFKGESMLYDSPVRTYEILA
ncbi:N-acetyltransferase [Segetibacter sp. 3557_3]|uniref:GNAT family N-acetyltransferase n=1 Tax=Segetibacter sp. 3557_3 TaxID=2547429 RepID=UPI001058D8B5|nr:GNAT family N-acetyltransferase [Segetibacter sp. 3557_3]TDH24092.1 N-acetyltransferase [Segetibacter sp. 3557_3]